MEDHPYWSVDDQRFECGDELGPGERVLGRTDAPFESRGWSGAVGRECCH